MRTFIWTPASADAVTLVSTRGPLVLVGLDGESDTLARPTGIQSPRQYGQTATGVGIGGRTLELQVGIVGTTEAAREEALADLIAAFADAPAAIGNRPNLGQVRYEKPGTVPLLIDAMPAGGPTESFIDPTREMAVYDCSLWCPDPRWRGLEEIQVDLTDTYGGFSWPLSFPLTMTAVNTGGIIENAGSAQSALLVRLHGAFTTGRIVNDSTGEVIEVEGLVDEDDYVEVSTTFGNKYVKLYRSSGSVENILGRYNLETSTFFQLPPGTTNLRFEADEVTTGYAEVFYTPHYAGA